MLTGDPETAGLLFEERPLDEKLIQYSIQDATLLPGLYDTFDKVIEPSWRKKVENEVPSLNNHGFALHGTEFLSPLDLLEASIGPTNHLLWLGSITPASLATHSLILPIGRNADGMRQGPW